MGNSEYKTKMDDYIGTIVKEMVDHPDEVRLEMIQGEQTLQIIIHCAKKDVGKIIGKAGKNIQAVRTILIAVAAKNRKRCVLTIADE